MQDLLGRAGRGSVLRLRARGGLSAVREGGAELPGVQEEGPERDEAVLRGVGLDATRDFSNTWKFLIVLRMASGRTLKGMVLVEFATASSRWMAYGSMGKAFSVFRFSFSSVYYHHYNAATAA